MGRHIRILLLAAAAQPVLAFPEHFGLLLVVFFGSIVLVAASIGASCISLGCHKARGQCKIAVTACALVNVLFIVPWTVWVAIACTTVGWGEIWYYFVINALVAGLAVAVAGHLILRARAPDEPLPTHVSVTIPSGAVPGQTLTVAAAGQFVQFVVPAGREAGATIQVPVSTKETA